MTISLEDLNKVFWTFGVRGFFPNEIATKAITKIQLKNNKIQSKKFVIYLKMSVSAVYMMII